LNNLALGNIYPQFAPRNDQGGSQIGDPKLNALDAAVSKLHRLEKLRYPDFMLEHGMMFTIGLTTTTPTTIKGRPGPTQPKFEVSLEGTDTRGRKGIGAFLG